MKALIQNDGPHGVRPFLRWAGSKRQVLLHLADHWNPTFKRYVEPFAGSARLFFHIGPTKALLGDINSELINTYNQLIVNLDKVTQKLFSWPTTKEKYYKLRALNPIGLNEAHRAARFIYLNRYCFNGLYRTNLRGDFNVPYGGGKTGHLSDPVMLKRCAAILSRAKLISGDFEKVLKKTRQHDFVYMDPPYTTTSRRVFKEYDKSGFSSDDIERLKKWLARLANSGIAFLVSYAKSPEADYLSRGFRTKNVVVKRSIAGFTGAREATPEILISFTPKCHIWGGQNAKA